MAELVRVVIFDSQLTAMNMPGGEVWRWNRQRSVRIGNLARRKAPRRTGALAASVESSWEGSTPTEVVHQVSADAGYAAAVHEGTFPYGPGEPVASRHAGPMHLPPYGRYGYKTAHMVDGQHPQPFLTAALEEVMASL